MNRQICLCRGGGGLFIFSRLDGFFEIRWDLDCLNGLQRQQHASAPGPWRTSHPLLLDIQILIAYSQRSHAGENLGKDKFISSNMVSISTPPIINYKL